MVVFVVPTPPPLTREQRLENLKIACAARSKRKYVKKQITEGNVTIFEVIQLGKKDDVVGRLKLMDLLIAIPGLGRGKATRIMEQIGVSPKKRIRGLGRFQTARLIDAVRFY